MANKFFGKAMKRVEDPRFITGTGNYTDDMTLPGMVEAAWCARPMPTRASRRLMPLKPSPTRASWPSSPDRR